MTPEEAEALEELRRFLRSTKAIKDGKAKAARRFFRARNKYQRAKRLRSQLRVLLTWVE